jgi:hypothetical protein
MSSVFRGSRPGGGPAGKYGVHQCQNSHPNAIFTSLGGYVWNYEQIYEEDEVAKAMDDDARVWRVYNDEAERQDADMVDGWRSTLDTLLIFVGSD